MKTLLLSLSVMVGSYALIQSQQEVIKRDTVIVDGMMKVYFKTGCDVVIDSINVNLDSELNKIRQMPTQEKRIEELEKINSKMKPE